MNRFPIVVGIAFFGCLLSVGVEASDLPQDLAARRARAMERLGPDSMLILWSAPVETYSADIEYEYRQDSYLYYLTGIEQDGTILVLMPGNETRKEILFLHKRDPVREHWQGAMLSNEGATALSGVATVYPVEEFETFVSSILNGRSYDVPRYPASNEYQSFFDALKRGAARLALLVGKDAELSQPLSPVLEFARDVRDRFLGVRIEDASELLDSLRQVKTEYERETLIESGRVASEGHLAGMTSADAGVFEYAVEAAIEAAFKRAGADGPSYPSIVASGPNATVLHYSTSRRKMESGDLLLVDAAASYHYLTVDITRTYPVSGAFSDEQKDIYRIVYDAQQAGEAAAKPGATLDEVHLATVEAVKKGLLELGLLTDVSGDQYRTWYTHGACHWIGIDVHDPGQRDRLLEPGMAFVIEPGIYIQASALDNLDDSPENAAFRERVRPAFEKYKNIGVRIEDSYLLTDSGLLRLSSRVPRGIEEVESTLTPGRGSGR